MFLLTLVHMPIGRLLRGLAALLLLACLTVMAISVMESPPLPPLAVSDTRTEPLASPSLVVSSEPHVLDSSPLSVALGSSPSLSMGAIYELMVSDPQAAAALIENSTHPDRPVLVLALVKQWSVAFPEPALAWFQSQQSWLTSSQYQQGLKAVLRQYAVLDPSAAFQYLQAIQNSDLMNDLLFDMAGAWADQDIDGALYWVDSLAYGDIPNAAVHNARLHIIQRYASQAPIAAANYAALMLPAEEWPHWVPDVARALADHSVAQAEQWLNTLPNAAQRAGARAAISELLLVPDPQAALAILLVETEALPETASVNALNAAVHRQPAQAIAQLAQVPPAYQLPVVRALTEHWLDTVATEHAPPSWLTALPEGDTKDAAIQLLVAHYLQDQPQLAITWGQQLSAETARFEALHQTVAYAPVSELAQLRASMVNARLDTENHLRLLTMLQSRIDNSPVL